jgi:hypothetical protein
MMRRFAPALGFAMALASCDRDPKPAALPPVEAGEIVRPLDPLDCRTHLARLDTGEVTRKGGPFARVYVEGNHAVLREGDQPTFRVALDPDDASVPASPTPSSASRDGVVLAHRAVVVTGDRVMGLDRATGKVQWTAREPSRGVFALPGDMVLAYGETRAVAFAGKTGKEVFRLSLPHGVGSPELVDERLLVFRGPGRVVVVDPPLATGTLAGAGRGVSSGAGARHDLDLDAIGFFTARAARGDYFVVTRKGIQRIRHGSALDTAPSETSEGSVVWSSETPFANANRIVALDTEDSVYVAAYDGAHDSAVAVRAYGVRGDELSTLFDVTVPARSDAGVPAACVHEVALGRPDADLVVASLCGPSSVVALLHAKTGVQGRRATKR